MPSRAATFGTVVPIAGPASDIALDESRGLLYIANFTANRIDVMSTADYSIHNSMNVAPQPGALALSFDAQFLLIAHYGNFTAPSTGQNLVTLINLNSNARQTFATGDPPLGVAFTADGEALIVTTTSFVVLDPISGAMQVLATFANLGQSLPAPLATFPSQVIWPPSPPPPTAPLCTALPAPERHRVFTGTAPMDISCTPSVFWPRPRLCRASRSRPTVRGA